LFYQAGLGYVQYFTGVPAVLVGLHVAGATLTWIFVVWFNLDLAPEHDDVRVDRRYLGAGDPILVS
jgi:heme A synthase